jgi:hypothetical protein
MWLFFFTVAVSRIKYLFFGNDQFVENAKTNVAAGDE